MESDSEDPRDPSSIPAAASATFDQVKLAEESAVLTRERDKRIQLEIKQLQVESIKLERSYSLQFDKQKRDIMEAENAEDSLANKRLIANKSTRAASDGSRCPCSHCCTLRSGR